jgi:hypothetical protein
MAWELKRKKKRIQRTGRVKKKRKETPPSYGNEAPRGNHRDHDHHLQAHRSVNLEHKASHGAQENPPNIIIEHPSKNTIPIPALLKIHQQLRQFIRTFLPLNLEPVPINSIVVNHS